MKTSWSINQANSPKVSKKRNLKFYSNCWNPLTGKYYTPAFLIMLLSVCPQYIWGPPPTLSAKRDSEVPRSWPPHKEGKEVPTLKVSGFHSVARENTE